MSLINGWLNKRMKVSRFLSILSVRFFVVNYRINTIVEEETKVC